MEWDDYLRQQAAMYRQLAEKAEDPYIKQELLELAAVCEDAQNCRVNGNAKISTMQCRNAPTTKTIGNLIPSVAQGQIKTQQRIVAERIAM
jgi:hypothetical protein